MKYKEGDILRISTRHSERLSVIRVVRSLGNGRYLPFVEGTGLEESDIIDCIGNIYNGDYNEGMTQNRYTMPYSELNSLISDQVYRQKTTKKIKTIVKLDHSILDKSGNKLYTKKILGKNGVKSMIYYEEDKFCEVITDEKIMRVYDILNMELFW